MKVLVVVDAQNDFITGSLGSEEAQNVVPKIVDKINAHDGYIAYTMDTHFNNYLQTYEGKKLPVEHCIDISDGWKINEEIGNALGGRPLGTVAGIEKYTFGCEKLVSVLDGVADLETIELVGYDLDICVINNALLLKTYFPEIPIIVDVGCCAATSPENFDAAIRILEACHVEVVR